jgi:alpha-mannosidase
VEVGLAARESEFTLTYELRRDDPRLHIGLRGTWFQRGTRSEGVPVLRWSLPLALDDARGCYEVPFGSVERELDRGEEVPALQWARVTGRAGERAAGCLLLNDCKHGHSLEGSVLRLTLIRASYDPDPLPEIGEHEVKLAVLPFEGEMPPSAAARAACEFNRDLRVTGADIHGGRLPASAELARLEPENVVLTAFKKAGGGRALVLRLYEADGRDATARVRLNRDVLGRPAGGGDRPAAAEVDLLERPLARGSARVEEGVIVVDVPAHGIASVLVRPG